MSWLIESWHLFLPKPWAEIALAVPAALRCRSLLELVFLEAGVLIRGAGGVYGATTAATIWIVAAIGMTIGAGYAAGGVGLAVLTRAVLSIVGRWQLSYHGARRETTIGLVFDSDHGKTEIKIERLLEEFGISRASVRRSDAADGPSALGHSVPPDGQAYQRLSFGVSPEGTLH